MSENVADPIIAITTLINDPAELRTFFIHFHIIRLNGIV